ncbi:hypothetical protein DXV76_11845 [Rhodobacteraceae bacterium CCMM004]|nr:hypothetical protein DXV76_11845 [Rhodobacteraceae bacterium CCMM004]
MRKGYPVTPDGRYFVARGRLWRRTDPRLPEAERRAAVKALMQARRDVHLRRDDPGAVAEARGRVDAAKRRLGERGPVWWDDGAPDEGGRHPGNSRYADWWAGLAEDARAAGAAMRKS